MTNFYHLIDVGGNLKQDKPDTVHLTVPVHLTDPVHLTNPVYLTDTVHFIECVHLTDTVHLNDCVMYSTLIVSIRISIVEFDWFYY